MTEELVEIDYCAPVKYRFKRCSPNCIMCDMEERDLLAKEKERLNRKSIIEMLPTPTIVLDREEDEFMKELTKEIDKELIAELRR